MALNDAVVHFIKKSYELPEIVDNPTCYIYDLEAINKNIVLVESYAPPQLSLYYAMKANNNSAIMKYIAQQKFLKGIEIASIGELEQSLKYVDANQIIFTGPSKTEKELEASIKNNIRLINVESITEAVRINSIADRLNISKVDILLRINVNHYIDDAQEYMAGLSTKMGIDENQYLHCYKTIIELKKIHIKGIHVFSASGVLDYKSLIKSVRYVFSLVSNLEKSIAPIEIIDFGGGIGIDYSNNNKLFDIKNYFEELKLLLEQYNFYNKELIMELGTYLVGNAGYYTSEIIDIKEVKGYKHIIIAGGINHMGLPFEMKRKHPLHIIPMDVPKLYKNQPFVCNELVDISGPLCMVSDKLSWDEYVNRAEIGDIVVYKQAGAYCYGLGILDFLSHPRPEELIIPNNVNKK
jgi:diaminopimelate decarboxylase